MISPSYLAGFFDGEGCIHVSFGPRLRNLTTVTGEALRSSWIVCSIGNTDETILKRIQLVYGGRMRVRSYANRPWKTLHTLEWSCRQPEALLKAMLPYLHIKRERAILALEFIALTLRRGKTRKAMYVRNTPDERRARVESFERRNRIADCIRTLNHRGLNN